MSVEQGFCIDVQRLTWIGPSQALFTCVKSEKESSFLNDIQGLLVNPRLEVGVAGPGPGISTKNIKPSELGDVAYYGYPNPKK